jgi:hypothetical protein
MSTAQDKRQLAHLELLKSEIASGAVAPPMMVSPSLIPDSLFPFFLSCVSLESAGRDKATLACAGSAEARVCNMLVADSDANICCVECSRWPSLRRRSCRERRPCEPLSGSLAPSLARDLSLLKRVPGRSAC